MHLQHEGHFALHQQPPAKQPWDFHMGLGLWEQGPHGVQTITSDWERAFVSLLRLHEHESMIYEIR